MGFLLLALIGVGAAATMVLANRTSLVRRGVTGTSFGSDHGHFRHRTHGSPRLHLYAADDSFALGQGAFAPRGAARPEMVPVLGTDDDTLRIAFNIPTSAGLAEETGHDWSRVKLLHGAHDDAEGSRDHHMTIRFEGLTATTRDHPGVTPPDEDPDTAHLSGTALRGLHHPPADADAVTLSLDLALVGDASSSLASDRTITISDFAQSEDDITITLRPEDAPYYTGAELVEQPDGSTDLVLTFTKTDTDGLRSTWTATLHLLGVTGLLLAEDEPDRTRAAA